MAITGRTALAALLVSLLVLVLPDPVTGLLVGNAVVVALAVVDLVLAAPVRRLALARSGDVATRLREPATVRLSVHNHGPREARLRVRDSWPPSAGARPSVLETAVPSGERRTLEATLTPTRRGDRRTQRVTVRSLGPLGLAARQGRHQVPWTVRVLPGFPSRRYLPEKLSRLRLIDGVVATRGRGQGTEFDALREYVAGDDVRAIDWRGTARLSAVVVRTFRPERDRRVVLVLDTGRTSAGRVGDVTRLDHAMDAALLLTAVAAKAGDRVDLLGFDRGLRTHVTASALGEDPLARVVNGLAPLEPVLVESDYRAMVSAVLRRVRRRSLVVLFTDLNPAVVEESLLPALPPLLRRHTVVLAALGDPVVESMLARPGTTAEVYAAAAAERTLGERRRLADLLVRRGVDVVDAPPSSYASAVCDGYLTLKAAGRL